VFPDRAAGRRRALKASVAVELWRRISLERVTTRDVLSVAASCAHEALGPRWTAALEIPEGQPPRHVASLGAAPDGDVLAARGAALAPPGPSKLGDVVAVGLWPHGVACGALVVAVDPDASLAPIHRVLAGIQVEAEAAWDLAEQAEALRQRAPSAQELAALRERVLQRLWHELLTPVALLRAAHAQLEGLETDDAKKRPLRRIGTAVDRLGRLFDLLNDILWAREAGPARTTAGQLAEGLITQAGSQFLIELGNAGMLDDASPLRAAAQRLVDHARALVPVVGEQTGPVDLRGAMRGVVEKLVAGAEGRRVETVLDAEGVEQLPPRLFDDALSALLRNAFAGTPDGSRIELRARRGPGGLSIEVLDHGVGIPADRLRALLAGLNEARDPTWYSTGKPMAFGAGGAGLSIVRLQAMGAWRGWRFEAESTLCPHVDGEGRGCPGDAGKCPHIAASSECARLPKGTLVRIRMP